MRSQLFELDCGSETDLVVDIENDYFGEPHKAAAETPENALTTFLRSDASLAQLRIENFARDQEEGSEVIFVYNAGDKRAALAVTEQLGSGWIIPHLRICQSLLDSP